MKKEIANKSGVMAAQRKLLESRYILQPKLDPQAKMTRSKPLPVGPAARLQAGMNWQQIGELRPEEIQQRGIFPYPSLPHPLQTNGGQVFPKIQIDMFPRLERFDIDHDIPEAFLPEFPPAIFLNNRPELGDVSRGEVVSINNFYRLFKDILTPVQLDGLQFLLTPFPRLRRGEMCSSAKASVQAATGPFYLDNQMHDLHLERFLKGEPGDGPIKTFTLRGIKESLPYMHDGRCFTLDTVVVLQHCSATETRASAEAGFSGIHAAVVTASEQKEKQRR